MDKLDEIRSRIDEIDSKLADLFEQRMTESRKVLEYKKEKGLSVRDPLREAEVVRCSSQRISDDTVREYFMEFERGLISLSCKYQERLLKGLKVAYCGVPGAFASIAASKMFPEAQLHPYSDFAGAYKACETGECDVAVLPIENSFAGEVSAVTDLLFSGTLYINQVVEIEAVQNLLGTEDATLESIKSVVSHPQALSQCSDYIREHGFTPHEYHNTAAAAKMVAERRDISVAAIASAESADLYGLKIIDRRINTGSVNTTRFAALSKSLRHDRGERESMGDHFILMFTVKNEAGALANTLNIIGAHGFNMCCLRSRPMKELMWSYYFYIELDGNINTEEGRNMLRELSSLCDRFKLVGSF